MSEEPGVALNKFARDRIDRLRSEPEAEDILFPEDECLGNRITPFGEG